LAHNRGSKHVTMNDLARSNARTNAQGFAYKPLDSHHVTDVERLENELMQGSAWTEEQIQDELGRSDRIWWAAYEDDPSSPLTDKAMFAGYIGAMVVDQDLQILRIGVDPSVQRRGIASELLERAASVARDLNAKTSSLEVRAGNSSAIAFYEKAGYERCATRKGYYPGGEDASIYVMKGLPVDSGKLAGMEVESLACAPKEIRPIIRPLICAIESSCDETAASIIDGDGVLLSDVVASQVDFHARFGGVVPEIASRKHIEAIEGVCDEARSLAAQKLGLDHLDWKEIDAVAATYTPGLVGALVVGVAYAKGVAWACGIPFIGVNHLEGHLYANKLAEGGFEPPAVASLVSGGNTLLVYVSDWGSYEILGQTIDDAVGEAFDKIAKALGLGYPGGPVISEAAKRGNPDAIDFPRALIHSGDLRMSLSGLKTAVVNYINNERANGREVKVNDVAASFEQAGVDVQVAKAKAALEQTGAPVFCLGGGVAANPRLREAYEKMCADMDVKLVMSPVHACGDNAAMIALVALDRYRHGKFFGMEADAYAQSDLSAPY
ncbi:MAG: tRNA (adenosine(37)-N6)-threonylcarbamoyltransferase complex transferase subunit TsaD, partial [Eggerthellaceae bacterium]|nr:tRNA (adenosine(37)-N6)-threonylcarbamoyltransferase complex transferase subunit TsaD [Eggerthellaceae bacterium]